ncbi:hypothetical protein Pcinc_019533 [Petrolisthes cinctipes]|uniref:Uncharacterized protein n=1 Tax=Petrolisthes cinctipes TaxID=88211 RepID=A0AAE1FJW9_PETCI|nr:hypothetical protein Pcinc_019533 [Petrolisthes cinctipes]
MEEYDDVTYIFYGRTHRSSPSQPHHPILSHRATCLRFPPSYLNPPYRISSFPQPRSALTSPTHLIAASPHSTYTLQYHRPAPPWTQVR